MRGVVVGLGRCRQTDGELLLSAQDLRSNLWQLTSTYILPAEEIVQPLGILVALVDITVSIPGVFSCAEIHGQ